MMIAVAGLVWAALFVRYGGGFKDALRYGAPSSTSMNKVMQEDIYSLKRLSKSWVDKLPAGLQTYNIVQGAENMPRIVQASIDPLDVHVGNIQTLSLIVQDPNKITSVIAKIQTDHGVRELPLSLVSPDAVSEVLPAQYVLNKKNQLVPFERAESLFNVAYAALELPSLKYEAKWKVEDTHDAKYKTTFVVRDSKGRENSVTLTWSDACLIPYAGAWNITSNGGACSLFGVDGVEQGNATIQTYTLTLNAGATFAYNSTYSITMTSGAIAIANTAQIKQTNIWARDLDSDTWLSSDTWLAQDALPAGYARRGSKSQYDCDDSDVNAYPGSQTTVPQAKDMNCDGSIDDATGAGCYVQFAGCFGGVWNSGSAPGCGSVAAWTACDWLWNGSAYFCSYPIIGGGNTTEYCI